MKNIKYSLDINKYEGCIFIKDPLYLPVFISVLFR